MAEKTTLTRPTEVRYSLYTAHFTCQMRVKKKSAKMHAKGIFDDVLDGVR